MNNKIKAYVPLIIAISMVIGYLISIYVNKKPLLEQMNSSKFDEVLAIINNKYVDSVDVNNLEEIAIVSVLDSLDPHSSYIRAEDFAQSQEAINGNFEGIGVQFRLESDTIFIVNTIPKGPSEKIGIRSGDRIVTINDSLVAGVGITNSQVMKLLKGPKRTKVKVGVCRRNVSQLLDFEITRDVIDNNSISVAYMIDTHTGFIKISSFSLKTGEEFRTAIKKLQGEGMSAMILDLRANGGGSLKTAIEVASEFFNKRTLVVYTKGIHKNNQQDNYYSFGKGLFSEGNLVALVDEYSASASEIVAGAIQDQDRGIIAGRRTFGKGLVQEQIELSDNSALHLTISRYYTPSGRCIQKPYSKGKENYYLEILERYYSGELLHADSIHKIDSTQQFLTRNGRIVFGGGGIIPDTFVPLSSLKDNNYYYQLNNKSIIYKFAFNYTDNNRELLLKQYPNANVFVENFNVNTSLMNLLLKAAEQENVIFNNQEYLKAEFEIKILLKSYIGRNLFSDEAFYPVYNTIDKDVIEALKLTNK